MAAQIVLTPTPNSAVAVTYSSLKDSFQGNQLESSWSLWAGGILLGTSWRPPVLLGLTLDKYLMETRVLEGFLQHCGFSCPSLMLQWFGHIPFREYVWSPGSPPSLSLSQARQLWHLNSVSASPRGCGICFLSSCHHN